MRASAGISDAVLNNAVAAKPVKPAFRMLLMRGFLAEGRHYANLVSEKSKHKVNKTWLGAGVPSSVLWGFDQSGVRLGSRVVFSLGVWGWALFKSSLYRLQI